MKHARLALALAIVGGPLGCAGPLTTYKFPEREYEAGNYDVDHASADGLLWGEHTPSVIEDNRSKRLGDIVVVRVEEKTNAAGDAATQTSSESSVEAGLENFFGLVERWGKRNKSVNEASLIKALLKTGFKGDGKTARNDSLAATIPCQVKKVLPNGDLFIEGGKTLQINAEESHLYMSGVVRPYDILMDNTVSSTRVLDARIDFSGRGVISDKQKPGLLHRGIDAAWPL